MGNSLSRKRPWRILKGQSDSEEYMETIIKEIESIKFNDPTPILFLGPIRAGKSSFINSVLSVEAKHKVKIAPAGKDDISYTTKVKKYSGESWLKSYRFIDTMGFEGPDDVGIHKDDIKLLLQGHIKKDYKFDQSTPIKPGTKYYLTDPKPKDKTHCVVFVFEAMSMVVGITDEHMKKIKDIQEELKEAEIPQVFVLTKCDELCSEVKKDANNIFRSEKVEKAVKMARDQFSIDISSIHPVINYEVNIEVSTAQSIPVLLALRQILQYACYRHKFMLNDKDKD